MTLARPPGEEMSALAFRITNEVMDIAGMAYAIVKEIERGHGGDSVPASLNYLVTGTRGAMAEVYTGLTQEAKARAMSEEENE